MEKDENKKKKETKAKKKAAQNKDELTLTKGKTINIIDKDLEESGCGNEELNGQIGDSQDNNEEIIKEESNSKKSSPPAQAFVTKLTDQTPADTEQSKQGPVKELPSNWKESWVWRYGLMIACILLALGVQYLFFGNFDKKDIKSVEIRDMERRQADFEMSVSTLKKQQINDKGIFNDMVEKFKNEMKNKDETKLKELTNKVDSTVSDVSSANEKLNVLEEAKETLEDKYKEIEKTFQSKIKNMESTFKDNISDISKFVEGFKQTFSNYETSLETFEGKINRKMQEMTKAFEEKSAKIKEQVEDFSKDFDKKLKKFKEAKSDLDEILFAVRKDVDTIKPNTFNKESLTMAFIIVVLFEFILALWIYLVQCGRSTYSDSSDGSKDMTAKDVLERIPRRVALSDFVCIVSFDEARQTEHDTLVKSALGTMQDIQMKYFVVRKHEHLQKLPTCKFYIMCTEFSERHVIIEEPGLGLGDLKRCTYEVIQRYRANMVILYTRDPGSRSLGDELYNPNIYCVAKQPELIGLRDKGRFISTYDKLTEVQKRVLHDDIAKCMK
ncbi:uncharacterized protein LOC132738635 isoform X2 [Ruditapes philippinarum]|uniref:uncharacterized protein LOC132738635 isoform X2 n=1 Tax=Ruditapes philippinarum TaxID=129788 RepID=UPI00295C3441|nr:uncharacterized protein LOC132738635 isoform X2 [Ruditapes philippinarum]